MNSDEKQDIIDTIDEAVSEYENNGVDVEDAVGSIDSALEDIRDALRSFDKTTASAAKTLDRAKTMVNDLKIGDDDAAKVEAGTRTVFTVEPDHAGSRLAIGTVQVDVDGRCLIVLRALPIDGKLEFTLPGCSEEE